MSPFVADWLYLKAPRGLVPPCITSKITWGLFTGALLWVLFHLVALLRSEQFHASFWRVMEQVGEAQMSHHYFPLL
jgi:hypothetical protein